MNANLMVGSLLLAMIAVSSGSPAGGVAALAHNISADQRLYLQLQDYVQQLDGNYGVAAEKLGDGSSVLLNSDQLFPTASMYKLLVMYRVFQKIEEGDLFSDSPLTITEDDRVEDEPDEGPAPGTTITVSDALDAMITYSSNTAAYALTREVGGWSEIISAGDELGMTVTAIDDQFWSTPADMLRFFELLSDGSLVSPGASGEMIELLMRQTVNDRIPALLPPDASVAHKTGELPEVRNDGGIVLGPGGRYIIVLMSDGVDPDEATWAEAKMSRMVYDRYGA